MKYIFKGLESSDVQPHKYKDFTIGKEYQINHDGPRDRYRQWEFYWVTSNTGEKIEVSNNARRKYFNKIKQS